jgi:hypothetical protein
MRFGLGRRRRGEGQLFSSALGVALLTLWHPSDTAVRRVSTGCSPDQPKAGQFNMISQCVGLFPVESRDSLVILREREKVA